MKPSEMVDSDLYQHMLSVESEYNVSAANNMDYIFNLYRNSNFNTPSTTGSNISISSLSNATITNNTSSTSISSLSNLSNLSDDDIDVIYNKNLLPQTQEYSIIDGGLQRALVIMYDEQKTNKNTQNMTYEDIHSEDDKNNDDNGNNNDDDDHSENNNNNKMNTFSFKSWMLSYKNQPHRILNNSRKRNKKYFEKRKQAKYAHKEHINNKKTLIYITNLRNSLPCNPCELRQIIKCNDNNNPSTETETEMCNLHKIDLIQHKILRLQKQLEDIRQTQRMKLKLKNWKNFKLNWKNWRLIDFYEYLLRLNGRKYAKCLLNFEIFYLQWMRIYEMDQKTANQCARFRSRVFNGRMLRHLHHNDFFLFGINLKEDRRQILMKIQQLNGFTNT